MNLFLKRVNVNRKEDVKINEDAFYFYHYLINAIIHNRNDNILSDYIKCHDCQNLIYPSIDKTFISRVEQKEFKNDILSTSTTNNIIPTIKKYLCLECYVKYSEKEQFEKINDCEKTFLQIQMLNFPIFCPLCSQNIPLQSAFVHAKEIHHCCMYYEKSFIIF